MLPGLDFQRDKDGEQVKAMQTEKDDVKSSGGRKDRAGGGGWRNTCNELDCPVEATA